LEAQEEEKNFVSDDSCCSRYLCCIKIPDFGIMKKCAKEFTKFVQSFVNFRSHLESFIRLANSLLDKVFGERTDKLKKLIEMLKTVHLDQEALESKDTEKDEDEDEKNLKTLKEYIDNENFCKEVREKRIISVLEEIDQVCNSFKLRIVDQAMIFNIRTIAERNKIDFEFLSSTDRIEPSIDTSDCQRYLKSMVSGISYAGFVKEVSGPDEYQYFKGIDRDQEKSKEGKLHNVNQSHFPSTTFYNSQFLYGNLSLQVQ